MDRAELIRRLKAARALGGFTKPEALAQHPLMTANDIKASRIKEIESLKGRYVLRPMELEVIARACGVPAEFFSAPFERMADAVSVGEQLGGLEQKVDRILERVPDLETLRREAARQAAEDERAGGPPGAAGEQPPG